VIWDKARFAESVESRSGIPSLGQGTGITGWGMGDYASFLSGVYVRGAKWGIRADARCCSRLIPVWQLVVPL
jgi:hypothetical protein